MGTLLSILLALMAAPDPPPAVPGRTLRVVATAYCQAGKTQSGVRVRTGIVAADPAVIPVGSVLRIIDGVASGIYTVMDTGAEVKGRKIDIFIPDCSRAQKFGEQRLRVRVIRHGWNPKASTGEQQ